MATETERGWFAAMTGIVLEGVLLACAMTLPFLLVSGYAAGLLSTATALVWWWVRRLMADPDALDRPARKTGFWSPIGLLEGSAVAAALGVLALGLAAMTRWGYHELAGAGILDWLRWPGYPIPVLLFTASAALFGLSFWEEQVSSNIVERSANAHRHDDIAVAPVWVGTFADIGTSFAYLTVAVCLTGFYSVLNTMYDGDGPNALEILGHAPLLALAIPAAGVATAARLQTGAAIAQRDPEELPGGRCGSHWRVGAAIRLACFAPAAAALIYSLHLVNVVLTSSLPAMTTSIDTGSEVFDWVAAQHEEGTAVGDIAERLSRHGHEANLTDRNGLFGLLPEPENREFAGTRDDRCSVSLQAGTVEPAELEAIARRFGKESQDSANSAALGGPFLVKYCLKIACPSLASWEREPMWALYSSHPADRPGWVHFYRVRPLFEGSAITPGGYCTAEGELADSYQG